MIQDQYTLFTFLFQLPLQNMGYSTYFSSGNSTNMLYLMCINQSFVREAAKKILFSGPATKASSPPSLGLVAIGTFFLTFKKKFFFPL